MERGEKGPGLCFEELEDRVRISAGALPYLLTFTMLGFTLELDEKERRIWVETKDERLVRLLKDPVVQVILNAACGGQMTSKDFDLVKNHFSSVDYLENPDAKNYAHYLLCLSLEREKEYCESVSSEIDTKNPLFKEARPRAHALQVSLEKLAIAGVKGHHDPDSLVSSLLVKLFSEIHFDSLENKRSSISLKLGGFLSPG